MKVLHSRYQLLEDPARLQLRQPKSIHQLLLRLDYAVEQLPTGNILHNQEQVLRRLNNLIELYDIGMADELQDVDLPGHPFDIRHINNPGLLEYLDGYRFASGYVRCCLDLPEGALTERPPILTLWLTLSGSFRSLGPAWPAYRLGRSCYTNEITQRCQTLVFFEGRNLVAL
jgi:hypothetical protein